MAGVEKNKIAVKSVEGPSNVFLTWEGKVLVRMTSAAEIVLTQDTCEGSETEGKIKFWKENETFNSRDGLKCTIVAEATGFRGHFHVGGELFALSHMKLRLRKNECGYQNTRKFDGDLSATGRYEVCGETATFLEYRVKVTLTKTSMSGTFSSDMLKLREGDSADCVFVCGPDKERVHCNKFVLAARSDVLRAHFSGRWDDKGTIMEEDADPKIIEAFVNFLYTDKIIEDINIVNDLLALLDLADKYNVLLLLEVVQVKLGHRMDPENATMLLAESHKRVSCQKLKRDACRFILNNRLAVVSTDEWKKLTGTQPELAREVMQFNGIEEEATDNP